VWRKKTTKEKAMSSDVQEEGVVCPGKDKSIGVLSVKQPRQNNKTTWLLAYGVGGPSISFEVLSARTRLVVDECYTATDRANKYTLIHLVKKVRETAIQKAMKVLEAEMGIVLSGVYGYDSIHSNSADKESAIKKHVLYKWMERSFKGGAPSFECWISPHKNRKGLFGYLMESQKEDKKVDMMAWSKRKLARLLFEAQEKIEVQSNQILAIQKKLNDTEERCGTLQALWSA
jgi:hypothetical protein